MIFILYCQQFIMKIYSAGSNWQYTKNPFTYHPFEEINFARVKCDHLLFRMLGYYKLKRPLMLEAHKSLCVIRIYIEYSSTASCMLEGER